jgi:ubiquinone/menaquinone biosynthesis C-methylase UbiE
MSSNLSPDRPEDFPVSDEFKDIYRHSAVAYDLLVAREDYRGNAIAALNEIRPLRGLRIVELGAGTGRLTRNLSVMAKHIAAFDIEPAMVTRARENMQATGMTNWSVAVGGNLCMPVIANCADLVLEGWSFNHVMAWHPKDWRQRINGMLEEMERILKPGGTAILLETMGTGARRPKAPNRRLEVLYQYWQEECGFQYRWIRTDYRFASPAESLELMRGVFSKSLTNKWLAGGKIILPQCTGIWWKHFAD